MTELATLVAGLTMERADSPTAVLSPIQQRPNTCIDRNCTSWNFIWPVGFGHGNKPHWTIPPNSSQCHGVGHNPGWPTYPNTSTITFEIPPAATQLMLAVCSESVVTVETGPAGCNALDNCCSQLSQSGILKRNYFFSDCQALCKSYNVTITGKPPFYARVWASNCTDLSKDSPHSGPGPGILVGIAVACVFVLLFVAMFLKINHSASSKRTSEQAAAAAALFEPLLGGTGTGTADFSTPAWHCGDDQSPPLEMEVILPPSLISPSSPVAPPPTTPAPSAPSAEQQQVAVIVSDSQAPVPNQASQSHAQAQSLGPNQSGRGTTPLSPPPPPPPPSAKHNESEFNTFSATTDVDTMITAGGLPVQFAAAGMVMQPRAVGTRGEGDRCDFCQRRLQAMNTLHTGGCGG